MDRNHLLSAERKLSLFTQQQMGTRLSSELGKAKSAKGEEMGTSLHMPCPLTQWNPNIHCPYGQWAMGLTFTFFTFLKNYICDIIKGMSRMSRTLILSYRLEEVTILMFYIVLNFKECIISPQPDVQLRWNLVQNIVF